MEVEQYYDKLRLGYFRVNGVGYVVLLQRHLVDTPNGGFWVEGKVKDNVPRAQLQLSVSYP